MTLHMPDATFHSLSWTAAPDVELVIIDFGLASIDPEHEVWRTATEAALPLVSTHQQRWNQFESKPTATCMSSNIHPLQMNMPPDKRRLVDFVCVAYALRGLRRKVKRVRDSRAGKTSYFQAWSDHYVCSVRRALQSPVYVTTDELVSQLVPADVCTRHVQRQCPR